MTDRRLSDPDLTDPDLTDPDLSGPDLTDPGLSVRVSTRLGSLAVRILGERVGDGPVTVFWPSMFVDSDTWNRLLTRLPGRRCVLIDPPGAGRSEPLRAVSSIRAAADAALDALEELRRGGHIDPGPVDWVGNAFGGHVGFDLALRPGVLSSLVAISSPPEPVPADLRRQIRLLLPLLRTLGPVGPVHRAVVDALLTPRSAGDPAIAALVRDSLSRPTRRSLNLGVRSFILGRTDVSSSLAAIRVPALFVAGDDRGDWSPADAERTAALTPQARAVTVTGARTVVPLEQPDALAEALTRFWA